MIEAMPNYYGAFSCIAGKCKHSCCIGWEIYIDDKTMEFYNKIDSPLGEKIRANIEGDEPHFILAENDRCPFLNENGLCDIILSCGENALCDICRLHPRFINFYSSFAETGLGLCCEEAARIILSFKDKAVIDLPRGVRLTEEEKMFFNIRQKIFDVLQNRTKTMGQRFFELAEMFGFSFDFPMEKVIETYTKLERLDEKWTEKLKKLYGYSFDRQILEDERFSIFFEQLAVYFIFRHFDGDWASKVHFALLGAFVVGAICSAENDLSFDNMADIARMYSAEIEYSEENIETLVYTTFD
ncbi:MAG: flagellin lysine-N-methylase [Clostridia bacterium]|nr:flagellin lysine-N-methylase [Clostridia bacterium]